MEIRFFDRLDAVIDAAGAKTHIRLIDEASLPADLDPVLAQGARASRFSGKAGQLFECFVAHNGAVLRQVLVGCGLAGDAARAGSLEKAGAAISAKYLTSGEATVALDLVGSKLDADSIAAVLLGLRLRAWRIDTYRSKVPDERKPSLKEIHVIGAPVGAEAAWQVQSAVAEGVEFTRELVSEPANVLYPETFVARCEARMAGTGIIIRVLDEAEMRTLGIGKTIPDFETVNARLPTKP